MHYTFSSLYLKIVCSDAESFCFLTVRKRGWTKPVDSLGKIGPYAYKGNQWISYDDPDMVTKKGKYIREKGLGGAMIWTIDFDDYQNLCCREPMPLLR